MVGSGHGSRAFGLGDCPSESQRIEHLQPEKLALPVVAWVLDVDVCVECVCVRVCGEWRAREDNEREERGRRERNERCVTSEHKYSVTDGDSGVACEAGGMFGSLQQHLVEVHLFCIYEYIDNQQQELIYI